MLLLIATISFIIAVAIGAWRQMCGVYELQMPYNCPPIWHSKVLRTITWLLSTGLSIVFAMIFANWIIVEVNDLFGKFTFGVFLYVRWMFSAFFGGYPAIKRCEEFANRYATENVNYDALAEAMVKTRRDNGEEEISKDELIELLKDSAKKISTNTLDDEEQRALEAFRKLDKR